jgi:hypothetical protein
MYGVYIVSNAGPCLQSTPKASGCDAGHASGSRVCLLAVELQMGAVTLLIQELVSWIVGGISILICSPQ